MCPFTLRLRDHCRKDDRKIVRVRSSKLLQRTSVFWTQQDSYTYPFTAVKISYIKLMQVQARQNSSMEKGVGHPLLVTE